MFCRKRNAAWITFCVSVSYETWVVDSNQTSMHEVQNLNMMLGQK